LFLNLILKEPLCLKQNTFGKAREFMVGPSYVKNLMQHIVILLNLESDGMLDQVDSSNRVGHSII